ncbi:MAG: hypothetical protein WEC84_02955 [Candidatus Andersenbacteria bacterium]
MDTGRKHKGLLVAFDGLDSSGKETQSRLFVEKLEQLGKTVRKFQTPDYTTKSGQELKKRLQGKLGDWHATPWQEKLEYFARNRAEHREEVLAALERGDVVVYDRYVGSSLAFVAVEAAEHDGERDKEEVYKAVREKEYGTNGMPVEDLSIFLDVPPVVTTALLEKRKAKLQADDEYTDHIHVQEQLYAEYQHLTTADPARYARIICTENHKLLSIEEIQAKVWTRFLDAFPHIAE